MLTNQDLNQISQRGIFRLQVVGFFNMGQLQQGGVADQLVSGGVNVGHGDFSFINILSDVVGWNGSGE